MISICFCGIDGSGKTSQVNILQGILSSANKQVAVIHLLSKNSTVISKFHNKSVSAKFISFIRGLPNSFLFSFLKIVLRLINVLLDSWITTTVNARKYRDKIVIYDRYFYDILVILVAEYPKISNLLLHFSTLIPKPNAVIILDINPQTAIKRKGEYSLGQAETFCELYRLLGERIHCEPIDANQDKEYIAEKIKHSLKSIIHEENIR